MRALRLLTVVVLSLLWNFLLFQRMQEYIENWNTAVVDAPVRVQIISVDDPANGLPQFSDAEVIPIEAPKKEEALKPEEPKPKEPEGQIVEIAPPADQRAPLHADYVAEYNSLVAKETRTESFKLNPEIIANIYSRESHASKEEVPDVGATEQSTGAQVGGPDEAPGDAGAPRSALPSPFALTNKAGLAAPMLASSGSDSLAGAPQNDRLNEDLGDSVALNARLFVGAEYYNRIRRMVNPFWAHNASNLPPETVIAKTSYRTVVEATLTSDGRLESVAVVSHSGSEVVDNCLLDAFRMASPFPNPPAQLIGKDGRVQVPDFDFMLSFVQAQNQYQGIDPRAGVQFPGILKNPR